MALFEIKNLTFTYPERTQFALGDVSLSIASGSFVVLCGKSGCGKSTLLRHLKSVLTPFGKRAGSVWFDGLPLAEIGQREQASRIGFVMQSPENQIVTDKVWHELAFGLESLGETTPVIRRRVAEMASFFGIQEWYEKRVIELSGGQKQLVALAAVLAMQPDVLILDEPTAQLDPIAAEDFIETLKKINDEIGTTIILSEHRLEGALPRADHVVVMGGGSVICEGNASDAARALAKQGDPMLTAMPTPMRVYLALEAKEAAPERIETAPEQYNAGGVLPRVPQTVREGRLYLERSVAEGRLAVVSDASVLSNSGPQGAYSVFPPDSDDGSQARLHTSDSDDASQVRSHTSPLVEIKDLWFRYEREGRDIVKDLALSVYPGELVGVVGGNGTGKSTMLGVVSGGNKYYRGRARTLGFDPKKAEGRAMTDAGLAVLPQDPQTLFTRATVFDNLIDVAAACAKRRGEKPVPEEIEAEVRRVCYLTDTVSLMGFHPYDVSGGEQQRTGLAMVLLTRPRLLLLDEPTKGMDSFFKETFAGILKRLCADGLGVLMVSHDVEFCAKYADRCALFFNGTVISEGRPRTFFSGNSFYTTAANRMARGLFRDVITAEELISLLVFSG